MIQDFGVTIFSSDLFIEAIAYYPDRDITGAGTWLRGEKNALDKAISWAIYNLLKQNGVKNAE